MKVFLFSLVCLSSAWALPSERIIGGTNATAAQFPFLTAIMVMTPNGKFFCSGSLITKQWVLTAGQCVDGATSFLLHFARNKLSDALEWPVAAESLVLHPDYNPLTLENDLGLIRLREPVILGTYVNPIQLPLEDIVPTTEGTACGWGQTSDSDPELSDHLQYVNLVHVTNEECKVTYGGQLKENMACFEGNYNEGICLGDTGGPLVQRPLTSRHIMGVASFYSANGCESLDPSGYTRVFPYNDWIRSVTEE